MALRNDGYVTPERRMHSCLFAMYHAKITENGKRVILNSFTKVDGSCRVLFATIAFGMGVNISDIHMVIHFGPSQNMEAYVQESGRAGRDGQPCDAILCTFSGCTRGCVSDEMKNYCSQKSMCRRQHFPGHLQLPTVRHMCCDLCQLQCKCNQRCSYRGH